MSTKIQAEELIRQHTYFVVCKVGIDEYYIYICIGNPIIKELKKKEHSFLIRELLALLPKKCIIDEEYHFSEYSRDWYYVSAFLYPDHFEKLNPVMLAVMEQQYEFD